jgi:hypothetical protein
MHISVADELAYSGLPEETRELCEKMIELRVTGVYDEGRRDGYAAAEDDMRETRENAEKDAEERGFRRGLAEGKRAAEAPLPQQTKAQES